MNQSKTIVVKIIVAAGIATLVVACADTVDERQASTTQRVTADDTCAHAICATGVALARACDPCATSLCAQDPYCCSTAWDATCVGEVTAICGQTCTPPPPPTDAGAGACTHPICTSGAALAASCDPCATALCVQDSYCCSTAWDATCVGEVTAICGKSCN